MKLFIDRRIVVTTHVLMELQKIRSKTYYFGIIKYEHIVHSRLLGSMTPDTLTNSVNGEYSNMSGSV